MRTEPTPAEVNIHLRAKAHDRLLIDQAAELVGSNRSQFMMASALKEAKNVILDQTSYHIDNQTFQKVLDLLDTPATQEQIDGMDRLRAIEPPWSDE
ncbi:MAG: type II toxin-antitoxin system TacA family antitoxin [Methylobacter sp.]